MRVGFLLPQFGSFTQHPDRIIRYAQEAERQGADSFWVHDRLLAPVNPVLGYNGSDEFPEHFRAALDPFALLTLAASVTERAAIGSNALNVPYYSAPLLARSLASIDVLSNGRLIAGLSGGWSPDEFAALGVPMAERGARFTDSMQALLRLWADGPVEYHGRYVDIPLSHVDVTPVQRPHPPVYLSAFAPPSMRRAARFADGFLPMFQPTEDAVNYQPELVSQPWAAIRELAERQGRDPAGIDALLQIYPQGAVKPEAIAELILRAGQDTGVTHCMVDLMYATTDFDVYLDLTVRVIDLVRAG